MPQLNTTITTAVGHKSHLNLDCDHVTTMDFMQERPVYYRHMIKDESIDFNALATVRVSPMSCPTFGRMRLNIRGFYVPFRIIFPNWSEYYTDTIASNADYSSIVADSPVIANDVLVNWMCKNYVDANNVVHLTAGARQLDSSDPDDAAIIAAATYDFQTDDSEYYVLNYAGLRRLTILESLGYRINWRFKDDSTPYSALGLLAYCKCIVDWYCNSQYMDSAGVLKIQQLLKYNNPTSLLSITWEDLIDMFELIGTVVYDNDNYFNAAWDTPIAPSTNLYSAINIHDITATSLQYPTLDADAAKIKMNRNGTPLMYSVPTDPTSEVQVGTQYIHDMLKQATNYTRRHALAGSRAIDRWLAQFGSAVPNPDRSIYLGGESLDINVGDVTSMANTSSSDVSNLGDYGGRGFGQGSRSWQFKADEFGIFIVISSIVPNANIYQGFDRNNLHISKLQFFNPEFDSMAVQAIAKREVYVSRHGLFGDSGDYDEPFGFTGAYGEYKRPISWVTGMIDYPSWMIGGNAWHLFRKFEDDNFGNDAVNIEHSLAFSRGTDFQSYHRIFNYVGSYQPFIVSFHFNVSSYAPCRPLFDTYDFDEANKKVELDVNGSKMN